MLHVISLLPLDGNNSPARQIYANLLTFGWHLPPHNLMFKSLSPVVEQRILRIQLRGRRQGPGLRKQQIRQLIRRCTFSYIWEGVDVFPTYDIRALFGRTPHFFGWVQFFTIFKNL